MSKNANSKETSPRLPTAKHYPSLSENETEAIKSKGVIFDNLFRSVKKQHGLSNEEMIDLLNPYLKNKAQASKICAENITEDERYQIKDDRHCNMNIVMALFYVFGVSIDEELRKYCEPRKDFKFPNQS